MARGRIIGQNLGDSEKIEALANDTHRFIYTLLVAYSDSEGRFIADSVSLNGKLYTRCGYTPDTVEQALQALHTVNLVVLYRNDRKRYGVIVDFHKHNNIRLKDDGEPRDEAVSRLPAPPSPDPAGDPILPNKEPRSTLEAYAERVVVKDEHAGSVRWEPRSNPGATPESPRVTLAAPGEVEVEVEVERKGNTRQSKDLEHSSTSSTRERHTLAIQVWNEHRQNLPAVTAINKKRRAAIDALAKEHGDDALDLLRDATLAVANEDFWNERGYGFDNLVPTKVLRYAEKWRAGHAQLGTANTRMATQVHRWAQALDALDERPVN